MGRGESNILYDPPAIKKVRQGGFILSPLKEGALDNPARFLLLGEERSLSLQMKENGDLSLHSLEKEDERSSIKSLDSSHFIRDFKEDTLFSITKEGCLWLRDNNLYFLPSEQLSEDPEIYPLDERVNAQGLHAGENELSLFWIDKKGEEDEIFLSSFTRIGKANNDKNYITARLGSSIEARGDSSILFLPDKDEATSLATIHPTTGVGSIYPLESISDNALKRHRQKDPDGEALLTPGKEDGTYFHLDSDDGRLEFLDLRRRKSVLIENNADLTDSNSVQKIYALRSAGDRALLLKEDSLALFDKTGLLDEIKLEKTYSEISFSGSSAVLWNRGSCDYLLLDITANQKKRK